MPVAHPYVSLAHFNLSDSTNLSTQSTIALAIPIRHASHELGEVESVCDRVAIMNQGELKAEGPVAQLVGEKQNLEQVFLSIIAPGMVADITIFDGKTNKDHRAVIDAAPQDVVLVMRGGKVLYGDDAVVGAFALNCDPVDVCGTGKRVCLMSEVGKTYTQLQTGAGAGIYPAFACLTPPTAPTPPNEPSCTPKRPTSANGSTIYTGMPRSLRFIGILNRVIEEQGRMSELTETRTPLPAESR